MFCLCSAPPARLQSTQAVTCTGSTKGQSCSNRALPFTQHCFQRILYTSSLYVGSGCYSFRVTDAILTFTPLHRSVSLYQCSMFYFQHIVVVFPLFSSADILLNRSQQLFASCTAKFADGQQCSIPVFDITHQTPLCEEHAKKMVSSTADT